MKKKIVVLTGIRSEYDIVYPILKALKADKYFESSVVVCGAHLSDSFGYTVQDIEKDGFVIADRIHNLVDTDRPIGKAKGAGILMTGLSDSLDRINPDYVLVVGDREESVVAGVVCTYLGIPLIHVCGGDRTAPKAGDVDEAVRHATSKMAALHFTMNQEHRRRLLKMGEEPWRVFNVGDPALDRFAEIPKMARRQVLNYFGFKKTGDAAKPLILVIQHVISGEVDKAHDQMRATLEASTTIGANCVINYPNSDMGSRALMEVIEKYRELSNVRITKNVPRKVFVNLLRNINLLLGNSSMGFLEGCFLRIPAINVGSRNAERMNGGNVVFVKADAAAVKEIASRILTDKAYQNKLKNCRQLYGDGKTAKRIVSTLKKIKKSKSELTAKNITY